MTANLLSRLEGLTSPDREVDALIMGACFEWAKPEPPYLAPHCVGDQPIYWHAPEPYYKRPVPELTSSLDAAVALCERVLPGWFWRVGRTSLFPNGWAYISRTHPSHCDREDEASCSDGRAATPAIALLIALLSALEARDGTE